MAKELPYFKFYCSEWISGSITLESMCVQGLFINICALYWFKSGDITTTEIHRRIKLKQADFNRLVESNFIKIDGELVKISFLDEQFLQRNHKSCTNSKNGSLGGAPKGNKNAEKNNRKQPKTTNIEEEEEEEEEEKENIKTVGIKSDKFILINSPYINQIKYRIYGVEGLAEYLESMGSILPRRDYADKFMREKNGQPFNDFGHILSSYNLFIEKQYK